MTDPYLDDMWMATRARCMACDPPNYAGHVRWFLITSYAYYLLDESLLTDTTFDGLCKELAGHLGEVDDPHAKLITDEMLSAGSGSNLKDEYPNITIHAAQNLLRIQQDRMK